MAVRGQEVEILTGGTDSRTPSNDTFVLNMLRRRGAWEVRDGFGQVSQYSSTVSMPAMNTITPDASDDFGIETHLGSHIMETNQGHLQIISVFTARVATGNIAGIDVNGSRVKPNNDHRRIYVVQIDDLTDNTRWEEALYRHTSRNHSDISASKLVQDHFGIPMSQWHGHYETHADVDRQAWVGVGKEGSVFFHEFRDALFFGNEDVGLWSYYPTHFRDGRYRRHAYVSTYGFQEWGTPYSESSRIQEVTFVPGFARNYPYFTNADLPDFVDMTSVGPIAVYGAGRRIYFSDPERPASIVDVNFQSVPSENEIVALEEQHGNILIFTEKETFVYRFPGNTLTQSGGQFTQISNNIGCIGPSTVMKVEGNVVWADKNSIYSTTGNFTIQNIGEPVERFFTDFMTNPLTSFYTDSGTTVTTNTQPTTALQVDTLGANMAYCPRYGAVLFTFPGNNASLVMSSGEWSIWTNESIAFVSGGSPQVGLTRFITNPWIVANQDRIFMVGSADRQLIDDDAPTNVDVFSKSYYLLEYGRGGAIDRSVDDEDYRRPTGYYNFDASLGVAPTPGTFWNFGEPFRLDQGYKFRGTHPILGAGDEVYLVPVSLVVPEANFGGLGIQGVQAEFSFDTTNWAHIATAGGTDVDFILPSERTLTEAGWGYNAGVPGTRVQVIGSSLFMDFSSVPAGAINITPERDVLLMWLPFRKTTAANSTFGLNLQPVTNHPTVTSTAPVTIRALTRIWRQSYIGTGDARRQNSVAQPVDWAYKSAHVGIDGDALVKARGLFTRLLSRGPGVPSDFALEDWNFGLYNTLLSADRKGWMSQVIDYAGSNADAIDDIVSKSTIRTRVNASGALVTKVFEGSLTYGASGATTGNYLIDDEETSIIATSDSVKGSMFSYMLFGHIQIKSQKIKIESAKALIRVLGDGRRRKGH